MNIFISQRVVVSRFLISLKLDRIKYMGQSKELVAHIIKCADRETVAEFVGYFASFSEFFSSIFWSKNRRERQDKNDKYVNYVDMKICSIHMHTSKHIM